MYSVEGAAVEEALHQNMSYCIKGLLALTDGQDIAELFPQNGILANPHSRTARGSPERIVHILEDLRRDMAPEEIVPYGPIT